MDSESEPSDSEDGNSESAIQEEIEDSSEGDGQGVLFNIIQAEEEEERKEVKEEEEQEEEDLADKIKREINERLPEVYVEVVRADSKYSGSTSDTESKSEGTCEPSSNQSTTTSRPIPIWDDDVQMEDAEEFPPATEHSVDSNDEDSAISVSYIPPETKNDEGEEFTNVIGIHLNLKNLFIYF